VIALVDYGAGNLASVRKALAALGAEVRIVRDPVDLRDAAGLVVPGVGHFGATAPLGAEWRRAIGERLDAGRPLLGICLGMQWLFEGSDEAPDVPGLGLLPGRCTILRADGLKVPHVGWNALHRTRPSWTLTAVPDASQVYFTHGYSAPASAATVATTAYGERFTSVVEDNRIAGVQFHPEKSSEPGLQILRNFLARVSGRPLERQVMDRAAGPEPATGEPSLSRRLGLSLIPGTPRALCQDDETAAI